MEWPFRKEQDVGALIKNMFLDIHQYFLKNGPIPASFSFIFVFSTLHNYKFIKAQMVCLGLEPGAAGVRSRRIHCAMAAPLDIHQFMHLPIPQQNILIFGPIVEKAILYANKIEQLQFGGIRGILENLLSYHLGNAMSMEKIVPGVESPLRSISEFSTSFWRSSRTLVW